MAGRTDGLIKNFRATGLIEPYRIVKFGAADTDVTQAAGAADASFGVSIELQALAGERVDVAISEIADVRYGGNVTRGDFLTSDAQGRAVVATPAAGVSVRTIGVAMVSGVLNDVGSARLAPGRFTG